VGGVYKGPACALLARFVGALLPAARSWASVLFVRCKREFEIIFATTWPRSQCRCSTSSRRSQWSLLQFFPSPRTTFAISHNSTHSLVAKTRDVLPWKDVPAGGGAATDSVLPLHRALIFVARCSFNKDDVNTLATLVQHDILDFGLDAPAWDRVLQELFDCGLSEFDFETEDEVLGALAALVIKHPANLILSLAGFSLWRIVRYAS
jgi:hypothetical protein